MNIDWLFDTVVGILVILSVLWYPVGSLSILQCIERAADFYRVITSSTTCLSSSETKVSLRNITECSGECVIKENSREDNYIRIHIKYDTDIILKLESKKNYDCGYSSKNMYVECTINQKTQGSLETCIIDQCINRRTNESKQGNGTNTTDTGSEAPHNVVPLSDTCLIISAAVIPGSLFLGVFITVAVCLLARRLRYKEQR